MIRATRHSGLASIMAMIFLVLCATLTVALYTMLVSSTAMTRNSDHGKRATWAAESGLDYLMLVLSRTSSTERIEGKTPTELLDGFRTVLQQSNPLSGAPQISGTNGTISIGAVALDTDSSFTAVVEPIPDRTLDRNGPPEIRVTVTGFCGKAPDVVSRTIGMDVKAKSMAVNDKPHGLRSRKIMQLPDPDNPNSGVYYYNGEDVPTKDDAARRARLGAAHQVDGGYVMTFPGEEIPPSVVFPTYSEEMWSKLNNYSWNTFDKNGTTFTNVRVNIPEPTKKSGEGKVWTITQNITINGVLYVPYDTTIVIGDSNVQEQTVTINGIIVWEPRPANTTVGTQSLEMGRYVTINTPTEDRTAALQTVLGAGDPFTDLLHSNVVVAPETDLVIRSGEDHVGIKTFNGGLHVNDVTGQGSGNVLSKAPETGGMVIQNGGITAEGTVNLGGNNAFTILPPKDGGTTKDENRYCLAFQAATYWEKTE